MKAQLMVNHYLSRVWTEFQKELGVQVEKYTKRRVDTSILRHKSLEVVQAYIAQEW